MRRRSPTVPTAPSDEIIQLINVIFGNSSIQQNIRVTGFEPGRVIRERFAGPRFGIEGVRARSGRGRGGLISPVIKPQGSSVRQLADIAYRCTLGGADIIKDDHGLANQTMAPFGERVKAVSAAVAEANARSGGSALYFVNVTGHTGSPVDEAFQAREAGAGGLLLMPGLMGFGVVQALSRDPSFDLPIMTHPSFTGPFVLTPETGVSHAIMYGVFQRLAGSDISVFPNVGGRFGFSVEECLSIAEACRASDGIGSADDAEPRRRHERGARRRHGLDVWRGRGLPARRQPAARRRGDRGGGARHARRRRQHSGLIETTGVCPGNCGARLKDRPHFFAARRAC
ncbi:RuBisCO large subunit C-terminal-like domain-containing protein [Hoeflea alexandrii]|uniref:RuBisCO large subunit C-terminal-like domain-containing protein n=1 Tax=Hoeflea alexandrii TaxID=288436 RepID=UPI00226EA958|nr:RuBisCO large subunit C-terminal-like domain-containing protein [Hoeflea alexandrii]MCY0152243.1 RuBisCO large subunit C-terminal-like domain-containing protein [Hoeflea alexandrii]